MILHISTVDKFIVPFIEFVQFRFPVKEHAFHLINLGKSDYTHSYDNVVVNKPSIFNKIACYFQLIKPIKNSSKVILHGLVDFNLIFLLYFLPKQRKKMYWYIWGRDLYAYENREKDKANRFKEFFRKRVLKDIGHIITYLDGDMELARKWYHCRATYHVCYMYPSNLYKKVDIQSSKPKKNEWVILAGHSGDPLNHHLELLDLLSKFADKPLKILMPLSYGGTPEYLSEVIQKGYHLFGDAFHAITDFMPSKDYFTMLSEVDVALFNHRRQMAMGNLISLLGLGKKVFLREDVTPWSFFRSKNIQVFSIHDLEKELFKATDLSQNVQIIQNEFSEARLFEQLKTLFAS